MVPRTRVSRYWVPHCLRSVPTRLPVVLPRPRRRKPRERQREKINDVPAILQDQKDIIVLLQGRERGNDEDLWKGHMMERKIQIFNGVTRYQVSNICAANS